MSGAHLSKEFFELVKSIGESRSKQEEDQIIMREQQVLKKAMAASDATPKQMKEYLIRMMYVEMLGHDASFGHINAVKTVHRKDRLHKRVGYLACCLVLHKDHQFMLLLVNTIRQDLESDNYLEVSMALIVVAKLVAAELIPPLLPLVTKALDHQQANVRKKAIVCIHRFYQLDKSIIGALNDAVRKILCDKDPSVMGASLLLFNDLCVDNALAYKDLVPSFVSILKQITEHRLPRDYDYHRIPAPWLQINLLKIIAALGTADKTASEGMYEVLHDVMKRADVGSNVGYAIVYETVRTVTAIYPDNALIEDASKAISRFIATDNHNLKYLGINALAAIVQINPKYAVQHQMVVIDCLEDPDETLKRKTLDLLYSMTNPANAVVIVNKLTTFLRGTVDVYLRTELVARITQLAEKYAPNTSWFINTMNDVFELGGELIREETVHNLMKIIAEGGDDSVAVEKDIRYYAATTYLELLKRPVLPEVLLQVIAWVLGEFGHMVHDVPSDDLLRRLCEVTERPHLSAATRAWFLSAMTKICAHAPTSAAVAELVKKYQKSVNTDLQQRAHEFAELAKDPATMRSILPQNAFTEPPAVDEDLRFLDSYVQEALDNGARAYSPPEEGQDDQSIRVEAKQQVSKGAGINWVPYQTPVEERPQAAPVPDAKDPYRMEPMGAQPAAEADSGIAAVKLINPRKKNVWGPSGMTSVPDAQPEPTPAPAATHRYSSDDEPAPQPQSRPAQREPEPAKKRELTEKEILAQSIFAGLAPDAGASDPAPAVSRAPAARGKPQTSSAAPAATAAPASRTAAPAAAPQKKQVDLISADLFDMSIESAPAPEPARPQSVAQPARKPASDLDVLSSVFGDAPAPVAPVSAAPYGAPMAAPSRQPAPAAAVPAPAGGSLLDDIFAATVPANAAPAFRPENMQTPQFSGLWKKLKHESKFNIGPSSVTTPVEYMKRMKEQAKFYPVQTIQQEMICAGATADKNEVVLVHGKLKGNRLEFIIKSDSPSAAQKVTTLLQGILA